MKEVTPSKSQKIESIDFPPDRFLNFLIDRPQWFSAFSKFGNPTFSVSHEGEFKI